MGFSMIGMPLALRNGPPLWRHRLWVAALSVALLLLTGCASGPRLVVHAFSFDGWFDGWEKQVDLLEYSYGDQYRMVKDKVPLDRTRLRPQAGVNGAMPVGEFLYVKWRIQGTGEVVEERVDLRDKLPRDMSGHQLTFVMDGKQLYVYLVTREIRDSNQPRPLRTYLSRFNETYEIYPNNTYKR